MFERFGLNRGEVGVLSVLRIAGPPHRLSPTRLGKGLMLSSAGVAADWTGSSVAACSPAPPIRTIDGASSSS